MGQGMMLNKWQLRIFLWKRVLYPLRDGLLVQDQLSCYRE